MGKKIIVRNSPVIRDAHLIGAGAKFPNLKDSNGNIQWRLSVSQQAQTRSQRPSMAEIMETALRSTSGITKNPSTNKSIYTPSK